MAIGEISTEMDGEEFQCAVMGIDNPVSQLTIPVDELRPEVRNSKAIERPDNLIDVLPNLRKEIETKPWLQQFIDDVRRGDKQAVFRLIFGGIVVTAAAGTAYELGAAHGRDFRHVIDLLHPPKTPNQL